MGQVNDILREQFLIGLDVVLIAIPIGFFALITVMILLMINSAHKNNCGEGVIIGFMGLCATLYFLVYYLSYIFDF